MGILLPSPLTLCALSILFLPSNERTLILLMVLGAAVTIPYLVLTTHYQITRSRISSHHQSATYDSERHLDAVKKRGEGDQDNAWASEYSTSIDRCLVSACLALDALDHAWPWRTAEVRKAVSKADECAAATKRYSSAARRLYTESINRAGTHSD